MKVSIVQYNVKVSNAENLARATDLVRRAASTDRPDLIILPEMSAFMSSDPGKKATGAEPIDGTFASAMSSLAAELNTNINLGSIVEERQGKYYNTSVVFGRDGRALGQYSKIHRFDVTLPDGTEIRESAGVEAGTDVVVTNVDDQPMGFAICYDLRFAELFRKLADAGAKLIVMPSAFLQATGMDHWEVLLRARAIENQCYVAAANHIGTIDGGQAMFGHSMIIDPWGLIVAQMSNQDGFASATLDFEYLETVRRRIPVRNHRVLS